MENLREFYLYTKNVLSPAETKKIELNLKYLGAGEQMLMEGFGSEIAKFLHHSYKSKRVLFICGTGRKGAIGMVSARYFTNYANCELLLLSKRENLKNEVTKKSYALLDSLLNTYEIEEDNVMSVKKHIADAEIIVDAIIGIGLKGRLSGFLTKAIKLINDSKKTVISIDLPSGINADNALPNTASIKADIVLSIYKPLEAVLKLKDTKYITLKTGLPIKAELFAGPGDIYTALDQRSINANKYSHGSVLILSQNSNYAGAPFMAAHASNAALAALYIGSGYVTILASKNSISRFNNPLLIAKPLPEGDLGIEALNMIKNIKHNSFVIGPGFVDSDKDYNFIAKVVKDELAAGNTVIADSVAMKAASKKGIYGNIIMTPHEGEFKELTGIDVSKLPFKERIYAAIEFAKEHKCTLVLKGNTTIITNGKLLKISKADTPVLATMGTGDVLSGIIAAFASIHKDAFEAAVAGVKLHSVIGDNLYNEKGLHITASDVINGIPSTLKAFDKINYVI
ncbi:MAG: NAD(P)H-hydrate dehydratase [Candidatus Micrarchaeia archaeon]